MRKATAAIFILATICFMVLAAPGPGAAQYLGETSWTVTINQKEHGVLDPPLTIAATGSITHLGGAYYTLQAYAPDPVAGPFILSGSGVLLGNTLYLTLNTSQLNTDNNRDTGVMHMQLDKDSLNGSFYEVGRDFNVSDLSYSGHFAAGTLSRTGALLNLIPGTSSAAASSQKVLLLDAK
jgi:hypothetical protein